MRKQRKGIVGRAGWEMVRLLAAGLAWATAPRLRRVMLHDPENAPLLTAGQSLKVLSWNVQYFAGKGYVFFYDLPTHDGPDERPSRKAVTATLEGVAAIIRTEQPDLILLQEVDDGARRTDYEDQAARLRALLPDDYRCWAEAFYWRVPYVPHPRLRGAVGNKLVTLSRYRLRLALRHALAEIPDDPLTRQFNLKRAVLEVRLPVAGGDELVVMNTHLDAFAQGTDTMTRQVAQCQKVLEAHSAAGLPWLIAGDFNLLPDDAAYEALAMEQRFYYRPQSELAPLLARYHSVPSLDEMSGPERARWYTHFPNDPRVAEPDRTLDYLFFSDDLTLGKHYIRHADTLHLSDHLPVLATFHLP